LTRDEFDAAAAAVIRRNYRHMDDLGGQPPAALLDGLWAMLEQHADDILHEEDGVSGTPELLPRNQAGTPEYEQRTAELRDKGLSAEADARDRHAAAEQPKPPARRTTRRAAAK
jgi:hypothetical protein